MQVLINNLDPGKNPVTTILGAILIILGASLYVLPFFVELRQPVDWYVVLSIAVVGICLLLIPDDLRTALAKLINKKADQL